MIYKDVKICSFAMALYFTAPFALADIQKVGSALSPNAAADLLFQLDTLQQEVQSLRGQLEEQGHELRLMKQSQRDRYIDLDKRISLLMSASANEKKPATRTEQPLAQAPTEEANDATNTLIASPLAPVSLQPPTAQSQQSYNEAYNLIRLRKFDEAEVALTQFVKNFPNNSLTGNGYYWLGEVKLVQGKSREAIDAFSTVIQNFPGHGKEQDSLYKLGTVSDQLGDTAKAKSYLQDVIRRFPNSKAAKLSAGYLSKIK